MSRKAERARNPNDFASVESWLVPAGRDRRPGAPLNVPPIPASNLVLGDRRAYSRDDGTAGWEALEEIVGGLEGGTAVAFASGMAGTAAVFDQRFASRRCSSKGCLRTAENRSRRNGESARAPGAGARARPRPTPTSPPKATARFQRPDASDTAYDRRLRACPGSRCRCRRRLPG